MLIHRQLRKSRIAWAQQSARQSARQSAVWDAAVGLRSSCFDRKACMSRNSHVGDPRSTGIHAADSHAPSDTSATQSPPVNTFSKLNGCFDLKKTVFCNETE